MPSPKKQHQCGGCELTEDGAELKTCASCHVARYCSVECQKKQWPTHKKTCVIIREIEKRKKDLPVDREKLGPAGRAHVVFLKEMIERREMKLEPFEIVLLSWKDDSPFARQWTDAREWQEDRLRALPLPEGVTKKGRKHVRDISSIALTKEEFDGNLWIPEPVREKIQELRALGIPRLAFFVLNDADGSWQIKIGTVAED